jgi:hypothetical protein
MKYVLIDRGDNIVDRVDLSSGVGVNGAKTYFVGRKQIPYENFEQLWKVMTEDDYNKELEIHTRKLPSQIEWWKDEPTYLDIDKDEK